MGYKDTYQNISARSLTLFIFAVGWARVSGATAVTFCVKCFNPLKLYIFCQQTSSESGSLHTFHFFQKYSIIMWSATLNLIAVTTLLLTSGYIAASKEYLRRIYINSMLLESAFHWLFFLKFSFKFILFLHCTFSTSSLFSSAITFLMS